VLENKLTNVTIHRCALSATDGQGRISFGKDDRNPGGTHIEIGETPHWEVSQEVKLRRLDSSVWTPVDFIKIDVEGAEKLVFDGAGPILDRDRPLIMTEVNHNCLMRTSQISGTDYIRYFEGMGYKVTIISPNGQCGEPVLADNMEKMTGVVNLACVPEEKVAEFMPH
jgi:hypothetical protein